MAENQPNGLFSATKMNFDQPLNLQPNTYV